MIQICDQCKANLPLRENQRLLLFWTHKAFRRSLMHEKSSRETLLHAVVAHGIYSLGACPLSFLW